MSIDNATELMSLLTEQFHRTLFSATLKNLDDKDNPLFFNNFSNGFRELIRHVINVRAPESEVRACSWFVPNPDSKNGLTRAHSVTYLIRGGLSAEYVDAVLKVDMSESVSSLTKEFNELCKYVHVNQDTFGVSDCDANRKAKLAIDSLIRVLQLANECRSVISRSLEAHICDHVISEVIGETIESIDELATHHTIDGVEVDFIEVFMVDSRSIYIRASGWVEVELQWGSDGDRRRGDASLLDETFPMKCELKSNVETPEQFHVVESSLLVNTTSWWENYCDSALDGDDGSVVE